MKANLHAILAILVLVACRTATAGQNVEVHPFKNDANLESAELQYLFDNLLAPLETLPKSEFTVSVATSTGPQCDDPCKLKSAAGRSVHKVVTGRVSTFGDGMVATLILYDTRDGSVAKRVNASPAPSLEALLEEVKSGADTLRQVLISSAPPPPPPPMPAPPPQAAPVNTVSAFSPNSGMLHVITNPPGAKVYVRRHSTRELVGTTPVKKVLRPAEYQVTISLAGYYGRTTKFRVDPGETVRMNLKLDRIYPTNPYKKAGHALFWPGLALTITGVVAMGVAVGTAESPVTRESVWDADREQSIKNATGVMWATLPLGAAAVTTGIILWIVSPGDEAYWKKKNSISFTPLPGGGALMLQGRF